MKNKTRVDSRQALAWVLGGAVILGMGNMSAYEVKAADRAFTACAMAPLMVTDFSGFKNDLALSKQMGMDAISVDVWWGKVEGAGDNQFDWSYYDQVFSAIKNAGLKIVPIMSFHECGGNVGDTVNVALPQWVWQKYSNQYVQGEPLTANNLKYRSSQGNYSDEYLSLWADEVINGEYIDFMNAFESHYGSSYANDFLELNVSCGPSGELRYPSYNSHDTGTGYPTVGALQCYSDLAITDFRNEMIEKYGSLDGVNKAWGLQMTERAQMMPPTDGNGFFTGGSYYKIQYGKDLLEWYNGNLVEHGERMIGYAEEAFDGKLEGIEIGIKMPGVHWQISSSTPRASEVSAGLIDSDFSRSNGYGYKPIMDMVARHKEDVTLHFTCLEMNDDAPNGMPKTLVGYVGEAAQTAGVTLKGENALSGGNDSAYFWENISDAIENQKFNGITILRMNDVVYGASYNYYKNLISKYKEVNAEQVAVTFKVGEATTFYGQNVYVVGSIEALGSWNPEKAIQLSCTNYPTWEGTIILPAQTSFDYKYIKKDGSGNVVWESGANRSYILGNQDTTCYVESFK